MDQFSDYLLIARTITSRYLEVWNYIMDISYSNWCFFESSNQEITIFEYMKIIFLFLMTYYHFLIFFFPNFFSEAEENDSRRVIVYRSGIILENYDKL